MSATTPATSRAVRLRLQARLDLARHATDLLHNKEEALQRERTRLGGHAVRAAQQWRDACENASRQLLRARALGGSGELARMLDWPARRAVVTTNWQAAMGVTYPGTVSSTPGDPPELTQTAALVPVVDAYRAALEAGAQHAAAATALDRLENELAVTRRRRRAIEQRLQPTLESQLHQLDLKLDERNRSAALRTQLATRPDSRT